MKKIIVLLAVAAVLLAISPATQAAINLPDPDLVGPYRIVFVTSAKPTAGTNIPAVWDMADLNTWVTGLAVTSGLDTNAGSPGWSIIGATTLVNVFDNTGLTATGGVPIYLVNGTPFATDYTDLWDFTGDAGKRTLNINENGVTGSYGTPIHTGLKAGPITFVGNELDSGNNPGHGGTNTGFNPWYGANVTWGGAFGSKSLFAISGVIFSADITADGEINMLDLAKMAMQWGQSDCANNDWCDGTDLDMSGAVGLGDLTILASEWLR
jgi:hypothetical protein